MKYIYADKLIAEIESEIKRASKRIHPGKNDEISTHYRGEVTALFTIKSFITSLQQEQQEVELEKFTEKMDAWKARYNYPDNIVVKGAMAFTARMFYMYPKVAREWYDSLPKVTLD